MFPHNDKSVTGDGVGIGDGDDVEIDDMALARLVGEMDFDVHIARQALRVSGNDLERAVDFLFLQSPK